MRALVLAVLAGWLTLRLLGHTRRWPWRVADLDLRVPDTQRPPRTDGPRPPGSPRRQESLSRQESPDGPRRPVEPRRASTSGRRSAKLSARGQREVTAALPAAADLLRVAVSAGHSLHGAIAATADFGDGPVCDELGAVVRRVRRGSSLIDEMTALPDRLGPAARSFASTMVIALASGAPVGPALQRLADSERRHARRQIEERVRRLPVLLLAPIVGLVLPAFVVLTIVPVVLVTAEIDLAGPLYPGPSQLDHTSPPEHQLPLQFQTQVSV